MGGYTLPDPTTIMGGVASISNPYMSVYLTNSDTSFGLGSSGNAGVADGDKGMGLNGFGQTATIIFASPVADCGAYWGVGTPPPAPSYPGDPAPNTISFTFSDGSVDSFSYFAADHSGTLDWHGWHFSAGITSMSFSGDFAAVDGLQANIVPEPATALLGAMGIALLVLHVRRHADHGGCSGRAESRRFALVASWAARR